jgi:hypothetical protein
MALQLPNTFEAEKTYGIQRYQWIKGLGLPRLPTGTNLVLGVLSGLLTGKAQRLMLRGVEE